MKLRKMLAMFIAVLLIAASFSTLAFAKGMDVANWNDYYGACYPDEDGVGMFANANYKLGLDVDQDIEFDWTIKALTDEVDAWITLGFLNKDAEFGPLDADPAGLLVMVRNNGGKLYALVYKSGAMDSPIAEAVIESINALSTIKVKLEPAGSGYKLSFNSESVELTGLEKNDFTTDGKTYLGFAAFSADSESRDATQDRNWRVSKVKVGGQLVEGAEDEDKDQDEDKDKDNGDKDEDNGDKDGDKDEKDPGTAEKASTDLANWVDPFNATIQEEGYFKAFADSAYNIALKPDNITAVIEFEKLKPITSETDWGAYVHLNLAKKAGVPRVDAQDPNVPMDDLAGISLILRNLNGKLLAEVNGYGDNVHENYRAWTFARKTLNINPIGTKLEISFRYSGGGWNLYINDSKINDEKITVPKGYVINDQGKTYFSFLARSDGDAPEERLWKVLDIRDTAKDAGSPVTGDNMPIIILALIAIAALVSIVMAKKRLANN